MKNKSWIAFALALTMAGAGTGTLVQSTQAAQDEEIVNVTENEETMEEGMEESGTSDTDFDEDKMINSENEEASEEKMEDTDASFEQKESEINSDIEKNEEIMEDNIVEFVTDESITESQNDRNVSSENLSEKNETDSEDASEENLQIGKHPYKIEMVSDEQNEECKDIEKTDADMEIEEAVEIVVEEIKKEFGEIVVTNVTNVQLSEIYAWENNTYRTYYGVVNCDQGYGYYFCINSITGQVFSIGIVNNLKEERYHDIETEKEIEIRMEKNKEKYNETAARFIREKIGEADSKTMEINSGSYAGGLKGYEWERIGIVAYCQSSNGHTYDVWMDPDTFEVFSWSGYDSCLQ